MQSTTRKSACAPGLFAFAVLFCATTLPAKADLLGIDYDNGNLYTVATANAALTLRGNTGITGWSDIQFSPGGTLYGDTVSLPTATLYTINPTTAATTPIGPITGLGGNFLFEGGLAFSPGGTAYATNGNNASAPQLFTLNLATGAATVIGTISGGQHDIDGLAYRSDGKLIGLDDDTNSLYVIDPTTANATLLAALPTTVGGVGGMTVQNGVGYFNTSGPGGTSPGSNSLYSFNLFTGAANFIGNFNGTITGTGISGLAALPSTTTTTPEPGSLALLASAALSGAGLLAKRRR